MFGTANKKQLSGPQKLPALSRNRPQVWATGVKNDMCLVWNRVRIWRTGRHIPTKNYQEYPPFPETNLYVVLHVNGENKIHWTGGNDFRYYNWRWWNPYVCFYSGYVHTIPNRFLFRHKKQSGKAMAQNWNKSLNASKIMSEQLTERVLVN